MIYTPRHSTVDLVYRFRYKVAVIVSLVIMILLFRFWPEVSIHPPVFDVSGIDREIIAIDPAAITQQASPPPAPAKPFVPIQTTLDPIIDLSDRLDLRTEPLNAQPIELPGSGTVGQKAGTGTGAMQAEARISQRPTRPPSVVRIVEPVITDEIKKASIRAEITVRMLVGLSGSVEEVEIMDYKQYDARTKQMVPVPEIGFGVREATIKAAMEWRFRPAEEGDVLVKAWSTHIFNYGKAN
jgi:hypothetical protein